MTQRIRKNKSSNSTGSPKPGEPVFLAIGQLRRSHGLHGEIILDIVTDFPDRITPGKTLFIGSSHSEIIVKSVRPHDKFLLLGFEGIKSVDEVRRLTNQVLYVRKSETPKLPKGQYYFHEIIGLNVIDERGDTIGVIDEIITTGANKVYVIKRDNLPEILIPVIESVILEINLKEKYIKVKQPEWV
jgi:16S rRNA processing protein RimM